MEFRVLGPLSVINDGGSEVPLSGRRLRGLLALLILHVGEVVAADRVVDELWGDEPPVDPTGALQTQVSRLRAALTAGGLEPCVETHPPGYVLAVDPGTVDGHRFEAAARSGRELLDTGEPARAATVLSGGLALWRGGLLADLPDEDMARAERSRLAELRRAAIEDRVEAELALGRHHELVGELEVLVADEPLRERRIAQLMVALYRSGRQADALRAYQTTRTHLGEELGIEPGAELRRLEADILAQDPALNAPAAPTARTTALAPLRRIPIPLSPLIGRSDEVSTIGELLAGRRLVTVVGPGGCGKTRLGIDVALRVADRFADGAALIDLTTVEDPAAVVGAVARALGTDEPRDVAHGAELVAQVIGDRSVLLLLDNCEQVLDEAARVAATLLGRCPRLSILATSRQGLGLPGEGTFLVPPLGRDEAVALFAERAAAVSPGFTVDDRRRPVLEGICERLDDLPLAIELAASRMRVFSPTELADGLADRFGVVTGGARDALPRQQTLRAVVDWSYDLLDDAERRVFERLSVFAGSYRRSAAEAVASGDGVAEERVAELLGQLVDKSLLTATPADDGMRFTMLQTLSEYGRERLESRGEAGAAWTRLARWLREKTRDGARVRLDRRAAFALDLGRELDTIRATLAWLVDHDPALAAQIAGELKWFWLLNDAQADGYRVLTQALARDPVLTDEVRALALDWAGSLGAAIGEVERAEHLGREAVELAHRIGDPALIGRSSVMLGELLTDRGRLDEARELWTDARRGFVEADDEFGLAILDLREGIAATFAGDAAGAYWLSHRAVRQFRRLQDHALLVLSLQRVGECADACGYVDEAATALEEALERNHGLPGIGRHSQILSRLAWVRVSQGRLDEALELAEEALALARRQSWGLVTGVALQARGRAYDALGRTGDAIADLEAAVQALESVAIEPLAASVRWRLAELRSDAVV